MVSGQEQPKFLPLRGLAIVLGVVLALVVAAIAARLTIQWLSLGSAHWRHAFIDNRLDRVVDVTIFGWSIVFVVWFRRARINAEGHDYRQRRARGWAFWGWIIPIVNLWFPFQVMGDIWRAGLPEAKRRKIAWLPALWWTCWLLSSLSVGVRTTSANSFVFPHLAGDTQDLSLGLLAICGVLLIAIIRAVSEGPVGSPVLTADAWSGDDLQLQY
jgi:Domain of unknown function (DUF4328)